MSDKNKDAFQGTNPGPPLPVPSGGSLAPDELQRQRQQTLQDAADTYEHNRKLTEQAHRAWQNQRSRSHMNLMDQVPKLLGAMCIGAVLAYILPMGADR